MPVPFLIFAQCRRLERFGLRHIIERLRTQTRWQVYARVLPVVFLAVVLVGAFGWMIFTRYAIDKLETHHAAEVTYLLDSLRREALVETMSLEARKADAAADWTEATIADGMAACRGWAADMAAAGALHGVALLPVDGISGPEPAVCLASELNCPQNKSRMEVWIDHSASLAPGWGLAQCAIESWHPTTILPPLMLQSESGLPMAVLPVRVRENADDPAAYDTVYFLNLDYLMQSLVGEIGPLADRTAWWCVVDRSGQVVAAAPDAAVVGTVLADQVRDPRRGPFAVVSGRDLVSRWRPGLTWPRSIFGGPLDQWVVSAGQAKGFPVAILVGYQARELRTTSLGYVAAVVGMALLALAIAVLLVTRVIGRVSDRVTNLARHLALVARGDYSRRLPKGADDEVGHLIEYFNHMADSLDETQRQLTEKTRHLEAALENRQLLDHAKDDFLVLISHEVRTPLTSIMGGVDLLKGLLKRMSGDQRAELERLNVGEVVGIVEHSAERLRSFMNDAIQMTSIQSSDKELVLRPESIGSLVELGLCGVREMAQMRDITVVNSLETEQQWCVLCDAKVLKLAFEKVLKNAVAHNHDGGRVEIREVDEVPGGGRPAALQRPEEIMRLASQPSFGQWSDVPVTWRIIEIFNTGEAIPPERCAALFGKFELVGRIENHQRGSGLSLPIAKSAIEQHGGSIAVTSSPGEGNYFHLLLPTIPMSSLDVYRSKLEAKGRSMLVDLVWDQSVNRVGGAAGNEHVGEVADPAGLKVEFHNQGAGAPGGGN